MADQFRNADQAYYGLPQFTEQTVTPDIFSQGISWESVNTYNDRVNSEGKPDSDEDRRDLVDDVVGTIADREIDTKNLDWLDRDAVVNVAVENVYRATS